MIRITLLTATLVLSGCSHPVPSFCSVEEQSLLVSENLKLTNKPEYTAKYNHAVDRLVKRAERFNSNCFTL